MTIKGSAHLNTSGLVPSGEISGVVPSASPIPIAEGGTNANNSASARTNLGLLFGTATLGAGTVTISAALTASSSIIVTVKDANPGAGGLTVGFEVPVVSRNVAGGTFVVRANVAAGTINVLDTSTFDWFLIG